jgi:preprotein translocase subunit Sss1
MSLATTVSVVVICVLVVIGAIGFLIDKHADRIDTKNS